LPQAENTTRRQLNALAYLRGKDVEVEKAALHAIEAVARTARSDPEQENQLLRALAAGDATTGRMQAAAAKAKEPAPDVVLQGIPKVRYSSILQELLENVTPDSSVSIRAQTVLSIIGARRDMIKRVSTLDCVAYAIRYLPDERVRTAFSTQRLATRVIHDLVAFETVEVWINTEIKELEELQKSMRPQHASRLRVHYCDVDFDIDLDPLDNKEFESAAELLAEAHKHPASY
jgi:hypothetical protein